MASNECPCGRARAGCEYHDPALQSEAPSPVAVASGPATEDLEDGGPLTNCTVSHLAPTVRGAVYAAQCELDCRRDGLSYRPGWAFHQDPPGVWTLADVPAGYDRAAIGQPVATQGP